MKPNAKYKVIKLTPENRALIMSAAKKFKGRTLFPNQVAEANRLLSNITCVFTDKEKAETE